MRVDGFQIYKQCIEFLLQLSDTVNEMEVSKILSCISGNVAHDCGRFSCSVLLSYIRLLFSGTQWRDMTRK